MQLVLCPAPCGSHFGLWLTFASSSSQLSVLFWRTALGLLEPEKEMPRNVDLVLG